MQHHMRRRTPFRTETKKKCAARPNFTLATTSNKNRTGQQRKQKKNTRASDESVSFAATCLFVYLSSLARMASVWCAASPKRRNNSFSMDSLRPNVSTEAWKWICHVCVCYIGRPSHFNQSFFIVLCTSKYSKASHNMAHVAAIANRLGNSENSFSDWKSESRYRYYYGSVFIGTLNAGREKWCSENIYERKSFTRTSQSKCDEIRINFVHWNEQIEHQ